jgi:hypothetical protein
MNVIRQAAAQLPGTPVFWEVAEFWCLGWSQRLLAPKGYTRNMDLRPRAFVALPPEASQSGLRSVIEETLRKSRVDAFFSFSSDSRVASNFAATIQDRIGKASFVVADVSGANPNVMLEVGMAMGMGKPLLLLSRTRTPDLPFDLAAQQVAVYRPDALPTVSKYLELWLRDAIAERA